MPKVWLAHTPRTADSRSSRCCSCCCMLLVVVVVVVALPPRHLDQSRCPARATILSPPPESRPHHPPHLLVDCVFLFFPLAIGRSRSLSLTAGKWERLIGRVPHQAAPFPLPARPPGGKVFTPSPPPACPACPPACPFRDNLATDHHRRTVSCLACLSTGLTRRAATFRQGLFKKAHLFVRPF